MPQAGDRPRTNQRMCAHIFLTATSRADPTLTKGVVVVVVVVVVVLVIFFTAKTPCYQAHCA